MSAPAERVLCARCGHSETMHPHSEAVHGRCMWPVVPPPDFCRCEGFVPPLRLVSTE